MKCVILAALLASVVTALTNTGVDQNQWPWQVGKFYRYDVQSYTLSRLQEGPSTGKAFRAVFILRVKAPGHLLARLEKPQQAKVHHQLREQRMLPEDLTYEDVKELEQPFEIKLDGGRVLSLKMPKTLSLVHENLLKGLMSTLQVDLSTYRTVHNNQNTYHQETRQGQFRKMETDVTGDCVTLYTVSPAESEWRRETLKFSAHEEPIDITKSKNYGHCHHRVAYHFGVPEFAEWTGVADKTQKEQFIDRATTSRILAGKEGPIYKAETTNTIHVHPYMYGQQKAEVLSYVRLLLVTYEEDKVAQWNLPEETRLIKSLLYSMTSKPMPIQDRSHESFEDDKESAEDQKENRNRRSIHTPKVVAINKIYIRKRNDNDNTEDSASSDSTSAYVNDDMPADNEPAYAALYMNPQAHKSMKQNPANAQKLVQESAQLLQNVNNMPKSDFLSKFNILVRVIAAMDSEQLTQTSRSIEAVKNSNNAVKADMWMIYRDAVAQAGTIPSFKQVVSWIENKKIREEEAAQVVATLANTLRYPTKKVMIQFFELAIKPEVVEQEYLNSTALIAAVRFINMGQVNNATAHSRYPTHMYGRLSHQHDNFVLEDILPRLSQALERAIQEKDSRKAQVYIKAIGFLGHRSILDVFAPYLEGKIPVSTYLRSFMIYNLHILAHQKDSYTRTMLYSILKNRAEPYEVRVAAAQNIFAAYPTAAMMQAMAQMTHDDPSVQVRSMLKSTIRSVAQLKNPRYWDISRTAQAAEPMLTKENFGQQYSGKNATDYFDSDYELGILGVLSSSGSDDSLFPRYLEYKVYGQTWDRQSISATVSSVQQLVQKFQQQMYRMMQEQPKQERSNHKYSASKVSEMLNIKRDLRDPLEAALYFNLMNQQRFFSFSEDDLNKWPITMKKLYDDLAKGVDVHYTKVINQAQISVMFPVAMGMPFIYKYKEPTVVHMQAKAKGEAKFERSEKSAAIQGEIQFTYARNIDGNVGFLDTLSNQYASAGVVNKLQINIPMKFELQIQQDTGLKIHLEPLRPEQDTLIAHYSVWPYTTNQKKDSLTPISLDPSTKLIDRNEKEVSMDYRFGQSTGSQYQLQGYSYSKDYRNMWWWFQSPTLSNIIQALYQRDVASTHFNFKYLGSKSQSKGVTFTAMYDYLYNMKDNPEAPLKASKVKNVEPNSSERRDELVKRVASGIKTAKAQVVDFSATFDGPQKNEFILTAAIANSLVDDKIHYTFHASRNTAQGNNQVNGAGKVVKPQVSTLNIREALKRELKMKFEADIRYGDNENGNIHIQGQAERTKKHTEAMENLIQWRFAEWMARKDYYRRDGHKAIVLAHTPDYLKASVTYKDVSPAVKYAVFQAFKMAEQYRNWYADINPLKTTPDGKLEIEIQNNYMENIMNMNLNSRYGEVKIKNEPIHPALASVVSTYTPVKPYERVANFFTHQQFLPHCTLKKDQIKTFSHRVFNYTMSKAWHVVMQDAPKQQPWEDELVVLARKPSDNQQEIYVSYQSETGKDLEIEIQPSSDKPNVQVKTNSKRVSEGDLTMYWDDADRVPFLQYYFQPDGVLMLHIREDRLRVMYDGKTFVVLAREGRNNTRGICGLMSGDRRDDYLTPHGLIDSAEHYAASYALQDIGDEKTQELQSQAKAWAYQRQYQYTNILRSDEEWQKWSKLPQGQKWQNDESSWDDWSSKTVFRAKGYMKQPRGNCVLYEQVQFYETATDICISMTPLEACSSHCSGENYRIQSVEMVCRPKIDMEFQEYVRQIHQGKNPQVTGVPLIRQFRVPATCRV